jgi:hypothetical protein
MAPLPFECILLWGINRRKLQIKRLTAPVYHIKSAAWLIGDWLIGELNTYHSQFRNVVQGMIELWI